MKYMTAKEEDILTSVNLIQQGVVLDKLLETLVVDKTIKLEDMLIERIDSKKNRQDQYSPYSSGPQKFFAISLFS